MYLETFKVEREFDYITSSGKKSKRKRISTHVKLQCSNCNSVFTKEAHDLNPKRRNNNYEHFCGKCGDIYSLATKSYNKKNPNKHDHLLGTKIVDANGYVSVYVGKSYEYINPNTSSVYGGRIREHIYIMQNHIGRPLKKGEVVHHIDGNKSNNDLSNLDLCTVQEHNNCHAKIEKIVFELYKKGIVGYDNVNKSYFLI